MQIANIIQGSHRWEGYCIGTELCAYTRNYNCMYTLFSAHPLYQLYTSFSHVFIINLD